MSYSNLRFRRITLATVKINDWSQAILESRRSMYVSFGLGNSRFLESRSQVSLVCHSAFHMVGSQCLFSEQGQLLSDVLYSFLYCENSCRLTSSWVT